MLCSCLHLPLLIGAMRLRAVFHTCPRAVIVLSLLFQAKSYIKSLPKIPKKDLSVLFPKANPQGKSSPAFLMSFHSWNRGKLTATAPTLSLLLLINFCYFFPLQFVPVPLLGENIYQLKAELSFIGITMVDVLLFLAIYYFLRSYYFLSTV